MDRAVTLEAQVDPVLWAGASHLRGIGSQLQDSCILPPQSDTDTATTETAPRHAPQQSPSLQRQSGHVPPFGTKHSDAVQSWKARGKDTLPTWLSPDQGPSALPVGPELSGGNQAPSNSSL